MQFKRKSSVRMTVIIVGWLAVAVAAVVLVYLLALQPWHIRWGATDAEVHRSLPGDDIVPYPKIESTRAITIQASCSEE